MTFEKPTFTAGFYCDGEGLQAPTDECDAGYYCTGYAENARMLDCPAGGYCEKGSYAPKKCNPGTYSTLKNQENQNNCGPCDAGKYCVGTVEPNPSGDCAAGYYCEQGSSVPTGGVDENSPKECGPGNQCPLGSSGETECEKGFFQPSPRSSECVECMPGYYCDEKGLSSAKECGTGRYCPAGSETEELCPIGTYNPDKKRQTESDCKPCDPGRSCTAAGLSAPNEDCQAGHWCRGGAGSVTPIDGSNTGIGTGGVCPPGFYCPINTKYPTQYPCPRGTYRSTAGARQEAECTDCDAGHFCSEKAMTSLGDECEAGYFCLGRSITATPLLQTYGDECPPGYACPKGTTDKQICQVNTYQPNFRQSDISCLPCPAGFDCYEQGIGNNLYTTDADGNVESDYSAFMNLCPTVSIW